MKEGANKMIQYYIYAIIKTLWNNDLMKDNLMDASIILDQARVKNKHNIKYDLSLGPMCPRPHDVPYNAVILYVTATASCYHIFYHIL